MKHKFFRCMAHLGFNYFNLLTYIQFLQTFTPKTWKMLKDTTANKTEREGQIYATWVVQLRDLIPFYSFLFTQTCWRKANLPGYLLNIQNNLVLLKSLAIKEVMIEWKPLFWKNIDTFFNYVNYSIIYTLPFNNCVNKLFM